MSLFQKSVEQKYLKQLDSKLIEAKFSEFKSYFSNPEIQENIRNSKEEQFQEGFLRELFVKILGYTLNPSPNFNLTTEYKNVKDSKKADGAMLIDEKVKGIIELKGTDTTDLAKVESQAFGYKNNQPDCIYIITSNFEKLRFYIDNAIEHIEFNIFALNRQDFDILYLCLSFESISKGIPKKIKDESVSHEDKITKELYRDYSVFKTELYQNLVKLNPQFDSLTLYKKSQKLLDRFLFLFFAEDRNLLPPNSVRLILSDWKELKERDVYIPLYDRYKKYFEYLNTGYKGKRYDVYAYNGGLFKPDEVLDTIIIDDDLLQEHTFNLAEYDFESEVDVNILGHIFENSLNELDEIKAKLEGKEVDKSKTKRKKDGVFYTPKYITKYIVENTVGKLCAEKKAELQINEADYTTDKKRQLKTKQALLAKLDTYSKWLLEITICDPACGSGAFLNQALDFLIAEHRNIDELKAKLYGVPMILSDIEKSILENNLFGVDLNEESVEIAKLSLWLRTAQPNRKLNDLNNNIKCGNSLIDDPAVAGDKAFSWQKEFPKVFEKGGFDVVIGNPPYVFARDNFQQKEKDYYIEKYVSSKYQINTYLLFIEKSVHLIKQQGIYGLIIPNSWLMVYSGEGLRKFLLETSKLDKIINLEGYSFESANVETVILIAEKECIKKENLVSIYLNNGTEFYFSHTRNQVDFSKNEGHEFKVFLNDESNELTSKIVANSDFLVDVANIKAGLKAYQSGKGKPKQTEDDVKTRPFDYSYKFDESTFPYLEGRDIARYKISWSKSYLKFGEHLAEPRMFHGEKLILREITGVFPHSIYATYSEEVYLFNMSNIAIIPKLKDISLKYILAILNSSLISYYFINNTAKSVRKLFPKIILNDLKKFPIKNISLPEQQPFIQKADLMLSLNKELQEVSQKFQRTIQRKSSLEELSNKLQDWYLLTYKEFIAELGKKKVKLSLSDEAEWEEYFVQEQKKALELKNKIDTTDKEIDQMVYQLYRLTEEEIEIVEKA